MQQVVRTRQVFSMLGQSHNGSFDVLNEGGKYLLNHLLWVIFETGQTCRRSRYLVVPSPISHLMKEENAL